MSIVETWSLQTVARPNYKHCEIDSYMPMRTRNFYTENLMSDSVSGAMLATLEIPVNGRELSATDVARFKDYLKKHLTSDVVLSVLEECLLEENATYNPINFEQALQDLQQRDAGRYQMLKVLLEGFVMKEGLVMLDPKLVTASYKQRMAQLEVLKSMKPFRRFLFRMGQAVSGLMSEKSETEAIQEAIQITGEVQIARDELAVLELKKAQAVKEAINIQIQTSDERRQKLEDADRATEKIYQEGRAAVASERTEANRYLNAVYAQLEDRRQELAILNHERAQLLSQGVMGVDQLNRDVNERFLRDVRSAPGSDSGSSGRSESEDQMWRDSARRP